MKLRENEKILIEAKMHWNGFGLHVAFMLAVIFMAIATKSMTIISFVIFSPVPLMVAIFRNRFRKYIVTTERLYVEDGVLSKLKTDIPITKINDVQLAQSFAQRMLNSGNLLIMTGNDAKIKIKDIENAEDFREALTKRAA